MTRIDSSSTSLLLPKTTTDQPRKGRRASIFGGTSLQGQTKTLRRRGSTGRMFGSSQEDTSSSSEPRKLRRRGSTGRIFDDEEQHSTERRKFRRSASAGRMFGGRSKEEDKPETTHHRRGSTGRMFGQPAKEDEEDRSQPKMLRRRGSTGRMFGQQEKVKQSRTKKRNATSRPRLRKASSQNEMRRIFSSSNDDGSDADWLAAEDSSDFFKERSNGEEAKSEGSDRNETKQRLREISDGLNRAYNEKYQRKNLTGKLKELYQDFSTTKCPEKQQRLTRSNSEKLLELEEQIENYEDTIHVIQKKTSRPFIQLNFAECVA